jgi:uncharacterized small protein (DUF1192 family)
MMEEEDRKEPAKPGPAAGEDLSNLSVEELNHALSCSRLKLPA